jgi:hypothetical protein
VLSISREAITFTAGGERIFSGPPTKVEPIDAGPGKGRLLNDAKGTWNCFRLRFGGKKYTFDYVPYGTRCRPVDYYLHCADEDGLKQQLLVGEYVIETLLKLTKESQAPSRTQ